MNKNKFIDIFSTIISIIFVVLSVSIIFSVFKLNIFNSIYFSIFTVMIILLLILQIRMMNNKNKKNITRVFSIFISIIFIIIYLFCIFYIITTSNFIKKVTKTKNEYLTYYVKSNYYSKINELNDKTIGFTYNSIYGDEAKKALSSKSHISFNAKDYDSFNSMNDEYKDKKIEAVVLEKSYLLSLKENNINIFNDYKTIYKFKVKVKKNINTSKTNVSKPFILYISGSDSRGSISDTARSDVNIVAVINPTTHKILLISIPRDYYVQLHGTTGTKDKLTHAGIYGVSESRDTINDLLGINIDYYLKVGFDTVISSVDLLGGIDIYSDTTFKSGDCRFTENTTIHVDGKCALAFSRERHAYKTGDRHRGENQEQVLSKMIEKIITPSILIKYDEYLNTLNGSFETDMSYNNITNIIKNELSVRKKYEIESISLDGTGSSEPTYSMGSTKLYVMIPDENTINVAKEKINEYLK